MTCGSVSVDTLNMAKFLWWSTLSLELRLVHLLLGGCCCCLLSSSREKCESKIAEILWKGKENVINYCYFSIRFFSNFQIFKLWRIIFWESALLHTLNISPTTLFYWMDILLHFKRENWTLAYSKNEYWTFAYYIRLENWRFAYTPLDSGQSSTTHQRALYVGLHQNSPLH